MVTSPNSHRLGVFLPTAIARYEQAVQKTEQLNTKARDKLREAQFTAGGGGCLQNGLIVRYVWLYITPP